MKQVCTFPYALFSAPQFNAKAYTVEMDGGSYAKPNYFTVFSPVHYPTHVGHYKTQAAAQKKADEINGMGAFQYPQCSPAYAFDYIKQLRKRG